MSDESNVSTSITDSVMEDMETKVEEVTIADTPAPKKRGRKPMTPEEKAAKAKERAEKKSKTSKPAKATKTAPAKRGRKKKEESVKVAYASDHLSALVDKELVLAFSKKVSKMKNADELQIIEALVQGFVDGSIEFEEKTVITVKK